VESSAAGAYRPSRAYHSENGGGAAEATPITGDDGSDMRQRSTIQFTYNDLNDAVKIAKAVHANAGVQCTIDQLAAKPMGGLYRRHRVRAGREVRPQSQPLALVLFLIRPLRDTGDAAPS
jgi:hypothetical protein